MPSIANRLAWTQLGVALLWSLAVSMAVWLSVREEVGELLDDTLREAAYIMAPSFSGESLPPPSAASTERSDSYAWQVVAHEGSSATQVLSRSMLSPPQALAATPTAGFFETPEWRVYGASLGHGGRMLYVAQLQEEHVEILHVRSRLPAWISATSWRSETLAGSPGTGGSLPPKTIVTAPVASAPLASRIV